MATNDPVKRPSADALLVQAQRAERGRLKLFLGAAPGVGKTFEMLQEGAGRLRVGADVVIAVVETHGRVETMALVEPFEQVPLAIVEHEGHRLAEMDLDAVLARRPALALVDEYAHSNAPGSRHPKRWQDVAELLAAGIDVYTTLNIQHVESLNDVVASFTRVRVRETVPDSALQEAEIEIVDLPPDELIERLKAGKVYIPEEATRALGNFFSRANLSALREMALRRAAESVDREMLQHLDAQALPGTFGSGERLLVAVSEQPGADALVRTAKRLADALHAPWTAVSIETPRSAAFDEDQRRRIAATLRLAATLGATITTIPAESVTAGLRAQAEATRATQLVIGKSRRSWWFELRHGSVVDAMVKDGSGLAVHVIPAENAPPVPTRARRGGRSPSSGFAYPIVAAAIGLTTAFAYVALPFIGAGGIDLLYLLPVIVAAGRYGLRPGLTAGLLAGLAYNFFFLPPIYTLSIADPQSLITLFVLIAVAAFTSHITGRLQSRAALGVRGAEENSAVAAFAQALARASDTTSTAQTICAEVARLLDVNSMLLNHRSGTLAIVASQPPGATLTPVDLAAAEWTWARGETAGAETATLNAADWQFHALSTALGTLAVLGVASEDGGDPVPPDRMVLLSTLIGQAALANERLRLEDDLRELSVVRERDRLRGALLSSIGHDLRTPLTSVAAAIEQLGIEHPDAPSLPTARSEVQRLKRFLDNLLDMARIDAGGLILSLEPIDLTDAVSAAVHDLRTTLTANSIDFQVPSNLPLVQADPRLLHHVLINLLANAAQHGGPGRIVIAGKRTDGAVELHVRDFGERAPDASAGGPLDAFIGARGSDRDGGSGLGLAIVAAFSAAMSVRVDYRPLEDGASFVLTFAVETPIV